MEYILIQQMAESLIGDLNIWRRGIMKPIWERAKNLFMSLPGHIWMMNEKVPGGFVPAGSARYLINLINQIKTGLRS